MAEIQIIKKKDGYAYKYNILNEENKMIYVTKSGFETPEKALEMAKKSYDYRINKKNNSINPIHVSNKKHFKIKKLHITNDGYKLLSLGMACLVITTSFLAAKKVIGDIKSKLPEKSDTTTKMDININRELITVKDCDFRNLHVILRTAQKETIGVGAATSDMLTRIGVSNEIVDKDSNLSETISRYFNNYKNDNIVVINLEYGYENSNSNSTIIMGDSSNKRKYSSDVLAACINESLEEYSLDPIIRSGQGSNIWRSQTYLEKELANSQLINNVSQLTIDLPLEVSENQIIKNDSSASIVEGIMRWTTLDTTERYKNIYYTAQYGDTLVSVSDGQNISIKSIEENSDVNMNKGVRVGNTILVGSIPEVATSNTIVYNPCTTTNSNDIKEVTVSYVVQNGDTVTKIANMYGVKKEDIIVPSGNLNNIYPGDTLYISTYNLYETNKKIVQESTKQL